MKYLILVLLITIGCSTSNIVNRGEFITKTSVTKGLPRIDILARFGSPVETSVRNGKKVDLFRIEQGESTSGKWIKGGGTLLLAIYTLGISEIIANPVTKKTEMIIFEITYDKDNKAETIKFIEK